MIRQLQRLAALLVAFSLLFTPVAGAQSTQPAQSTQDQQTKQTEKKKPKDDVEQIGNRDVGGGLVMVSLEREIAIGKAYSQEIERSVRLVDDPVVNEYVDRVGQNLVRNSDAKVPFTIKVIDSEELNAFALPGGFFYVNSGLILRADEEAELAGVMAHEIAHVTARHYAKQVTKEQITQWALLPLLIFGPVGWTGYGIYQGLNFFIPMAFLRFSRNYEREADYLGLQYMYKAGYDPNAYITFFEKLLAEEKRRPGSIPKIFSTHPPTPERIQNSQTEIVRILPAREEYVVTTSEFDLIKQRLREIMAQTKARDDKEGDKPTLRKRTEEDKSRDKTKTGEEDDRPVLKRRPPN